MPIESAADRLALLDADEFGVEATYTPNGGAAAAVSGVFDDPTIMETIGERAPAQDTRSTFWCREDDLPDGAEADAGDTLALTHPVSQVATTFRVATIEPDGQGMALLSLAIGA